MEASVFEIVLCLVAGLIAVALVAAEPEDLARLLRRVAGREGDR